MSTDKVMEQKLQEYLGTLPVTARRALLKDLQKSEITDQISEQNKKILRILEQMADIEPGSSIADAVLIECLFEPFTEFTFAKHTETKLSPRIMQGSLETIYRWLRRDNISKDIAALENVLKPALEENNQELIAKCQKKFLQLLQGAVGVSFKTKVANKDEHRKYSAQLGGEMVLNDALDLGYILENYAAVASLKKSLPEKIIGYDSDVHMSVASAYRAFAKVAPDETKLFFTLLFSCFDKPENILRFLQDEMQTDDPVRIAESRFAFCIDLILHEISICVDQISANIGQVRNGHVSLDELATYIRLAKMFHASLDTSSQNHWGKKYGDQIKRLSALLTVELSQLPQLLRQALGYVRAEKGASQPDEVAKNQAVYVSKLLMQSKRGSSTLALNALLPKVYREAEQYVDVVSGRVLDEIRNPQGTDKETSKTRLRNLAEISAILLDENYAEVLLKSGGLSSFEEKRAAQ